MTALAIAVGYLIGSLPTAAWIAGAAGIDLRSQGSTNPGANNARSLGGVGLGAQVLIVEIAKGATAVALGGMIGGQPGAVAAGLAALAGNILNVWYRFSGGQGLGISAGILIAAWPLWFLPILAAIGGVAATTRSAPRAAMTAVATLAVGAGLEATVGLPTPWGVEGIDAAILAVGMAALIVPKQIARLSRHSPA